MFSTAFASFVAVFSALFPVINPLGDGPIFLNMVQGCSQGVRNKLARSVSVNSFFLLLISMLVGPQILLFFWNIFTSPKASRWCCGDCNGLEFAKSAGRI